jgi:hypothetical protein
MEERLNVAKTAQAWWDLMQIYKERNEMLAYWKRFTKIY